METKEATEEKEEVKESPVQMVQVVTETQEMFQVNGETMNLNQYLVWIGKTLLELYKKI